jgi:hypothetical protein
MALFPQMPGRRIVITLWTLLFLVIGLLCTPLLIGPFLGDDYVGEQRVVIASSPNEVWARVIDHQRYPINSSAVLRVVDLDSELGLPAWEEEMSVNSATVRTVEMTSEERVVREVTSIDGLMVARWVLELQGIDGGCEVVVHQDVKVSATGMFGSRLRFVMRFMNNAEVGPRLYLDRLSAELELQGEPAAEQGAQ